MFKLGKRFNRRSFFRAFFGLVLTYIFPWKVKSLTSALPPHHTGDGFRNTDPNFKQADGLDVFNWLISRGTRRSFSKETAEIPSTTFNNILVENVNTNSVTWIGHSTTLVRCEKKLFLTDPVWSETAGPYNLVGANRYTSATISIEQLPDIDIILISHNHYDHLDLNSILSFAKNKKTHFFIPLGLKEWFADYGIQNLHEMDWWQEETFGSFKIVCTPAQHFSGRSPFDRNNTLWSSWTVIGKEKRFYFGGDSAYFSGFKQIGEKYGPFQLSLIPIGAYLPRNIMGPVHVDPKEAVQAFLDINSQMMLPIHWGTFRMADEPIDQPPKDFLAEVEKRGLNWNAVQPFKIGETKIW